MPRRRVEGRFTVSGPGVDVAAASVDHGLSIAQTYAVRHFGEEGETTFYVRDLMGETYARVTKLDGQRVVETYRIKESK